MEACRASILDTMKANLKIKRYDPEQNRSWDQEYSVETHSSATILDALIQVREEQDGSLALRCSCRASICGSCGMKVNGRARLVCKTRVEAIASEGETLTIEPMGNQHVIRDLVVDLSTFFNQMKRVTPYLQPDFVPEEGEFIAPNDSMERLLTSMNCIMCGCCVSDCTVLEVDNNFIGPAALAKAWRFTEDPRDAASTKRLTDLNDEDGGIWDCTRCMACVEVCPKEVAPMERIMELRERAISAGNTNTPGYRHTESFNKSVRKYGRLDEARLAVDSAGYTNFPRLVELAVLGLKSLVRGKIPFPPHEAEDRERITDIFDKNQKAGS